MRHMARKHKHATKFEIHCHPKLVYVDYCLMPGMYVHTYIAYGHVTIKQHTAKE